MRWFTQSPALGWPWAGTVGTLPGEMMQDATQAQPGDATTHDVSKPVAVGGLVAAIALMLICLGSLLVPPALAAITPDVADDVAVVDE